MSLAGSPTLTPIDKCNELTRVTDRRLFLTADRAWGREERLQSFPPSSPSRGLLASHAHALLASLFGPACLLARDTATSTKKKKLARLTSRNRCCQPALNPILSRNVPSIDQSSYDLGDLLPTPPSPANRHWVLAKVNSGGNPRKPSGKRLGIHYPLAASSDTD